MSLVTTTLTFLLIGFVILIIVHFISENIKLRTQMANDLRHLADIHRAATFDNTEENTQEVSIATEGKSI